MSSKKQIAAGQVRSLRSIKKKLQEMAAQWADVDEYNANALMDLADDAEAVAMNLIDEAKAFS